MNALKAGAGLRSDVLEGAPKGLFEERVGKKYPLESGVGDPEKLLNVSHHVAERVLGLPPRLLAPPPLLGHQMAPDPMEGFAQGADDRADQYEKGHGGNVVDLRE